MTGSILGTRVLRTEDPSLLLGEVRYLADLHVAGHAGHEVLHAVFVRSEMAHAHIEHIHVEAAQAMPDVVGVYTAAHLGLTAFHGMAKVDDVFARPPLAVDRVRFVGEAVAVVVARTATAARDAADRVDVRLRALEAVVHPGDAVADGAPLLFAQRPDNVALSTTDRVTDGLFGDADVIVRARLVNQRIAVAPIEPHAAAADVQADGRLLVYGSTQMPHLLQQLLATALELPLHLVRVVTPPVGGGFGGKAGLYPEQVVVAALALRHGTAVQWVATRSEDMLCLSHSRAQVQYAELGCRRDGTFTGLRVRLLGDGGAYPGLGAYLPAGTRRMANGTYRLPALQFDIVVAATNTTPTGAYRGAGRPEATALLERIVDLAALELGIDPVEIRRRNLIADDAFPFATLTGLTYDSGAYTTPLDTAVQAIGYDDLRREQAERRRSGDHRLLGIGVAVYVEVTAGGSGSEYGAVRVHPDGSATVLAGTSAHGQGHQTTFAMLVSSLTGIAVEHIRLAAVDTDEVRSGGGTGGSRSLQLGGSAVLRATEALVDKARQLAARHFEADVDDIVVDTSTGRVGVAGVPARSLDWAGLAQVAIDDPDGLAAHFDFVQRGATFPFGAHVAVVEVDRDTGKVTLLRHVAVDDCGTVINPVLVEGQQHGGVAAGVSQALYEQMVYDAEGNPLTATFMDYAIPSAAEFPSFDVLSTETPSPLNPLGAKGIGEASTIGSSPAVQNAVIDALAHLGVRHLDLPCTSETVWRAIAAAEAGTLASPWSEPPAVFARLAAAQAVDRDGLRAAEGI